MTATSETRRQRPPVLRTVWRAWASTFAAMRAMPLAFLVTAAASVVLAIVLARLAGTADTTTAETPTITGEARIAMLLASLPSFVAHALVLAPLAIALHRFVVLGERATLLPLHPLSQVVRYAALVLLFDVVRFLPALFVSTSATANVLVTLLFYVTLAVTVRLTLLFPQIAVDRTDMPLRRLWVATRWRFWNTATVLTLTVLPVIALHVLIMLAIYGTMSAAFAGMAKDDLPLLSALDAPCVALAAAAASWLFVGHGLAAGTRLGLHSAE